MLDALIDGFGLVQQALFEGVVQPVMFALGLGGRLEEGFVATGWLLVGLVQLAVIALGFGLLERWRPVEPVLDRPAVRTDVVYTLIHRLGLVRLALFFTLDPLLQAVSAWLGLHGLRCMSAGHHRKARRLGRVVDEFVFILGQQVFVPVLFGRLPIFAFRHTSNSAMSLCLSVCKWRSPKKGTR